MSRHSSGHYCARALGRPLRFTPDRRRTRPCSLCALARCLGCRRAKCHGELNSWDEAIRDYERAQKLDSSNEEIARDLRTARLEQKKAARKDYYRILKVGKTADVTEIKKAYRKLALVHHPDRVSAPDDKKKAESIFKEITEAYECLC